MIRAEKSQSPSRHVLTRSKTMRVERLSPTEFRVTPSESGKVVRIVRFHQDDDGSIWAECFAEDSKQSCEANAHARYCSHIESAILKLLTDHQPKELTP